MSGFAVSDSANSFSILNTGDLDVAGDVSISGNFNNRLAEKTITLFSPITFNDALVDSYYALNTAVNDEEGGISGFGLPPKSFITESSVILTDVVWTPDFEDGLYLKDPTKPVTFTMGYQIHPEPSKDFNGNLTYDSMGFTFTRLNAPGVIFNNAIIRSAEPKNGGGLIVSAGNNGNRNANIGTAGTPGNLSITPIWIRMTVPGVPNICGKKITHSAKITVTLTTKLIQS
jgi:hypothetical protein